MYVRVFNSFTLPFSAEVLGATRSYVEESVYIFNSLEIVVDLRLAHFYWAKNQPNVLRMFYITFFFFFALLQQLFFRFSYLFAPFLPEVF